MESTISVTPGVRSTDRTNLAYILAASYSGSTLLAMLLGAQPEACTVGEMRVPSIDEPEDYLCSCGEPIQKCNFWTKVSEGMARRGVKNFDITNARLCIHDVENAYVGRLLGPLPRGPLLELARTVGLGLSPAWPAHLRDIHHRNSALVSVLQEVTESRIVVDSSKIALHLKYLLRSPDLNIKVIWLVRDGRAVSNSMLGHGTKSMAIAALSWRRNIEAAERVLTALPASQWMRVQYEELCRQPGKILGDICRFLGMESKDVELAFRAKQQHVLGNDMRLKSGSEIRLDERWRTSLTKEDLDAFAIVGGELNRKYGYA